MKKNTFLQKLFHMRKYIMKYYTIIIQDIVHINSFSVNECIKIVYVKMNFNEMI